MTLSFIERTAILITSIAEREADAFTTAQAVVKLLPAMTAGLSGYRRYKIGESLIDMGMRMKSAGEVEVDAK